jgi:hypothetical protein
MLNTRVRKACRTRDQLAGPDSRPRVAASSASCSRVRRIASFREDLTSRGLEENIYRV